MQLLEDFVGSFPDSLKSSIGVLCGDKAAIQLAADRLPKVSFVRLSDRRVPTTVQSVIVLGTQQDEVRQECPLIGQSLHTSAKHALRQAVCRLQISNAFLATAELRP